MERVVAVVLGGGRGSRLFPLTHERAKPAVPLFGKYRLIDVTLSNCINSGINRVFVLTQFLSASLHRHIMEAYKFDTFSHGFVEILAAEQTERGQEWFMGTADAVRATLHHIRHFASEETLILSGDHLYRMDYSKMLACHRSKEAGLTLAVYLVNREDASRMGLLRVDEEGMVQEFVEKPKDPEVIERFRAPESLCRKVGLNLDDGWYLASMGIYVFNSELLKSCLQGTDNDFGSQIIPGLIGKVRIATHLHEGYWADIGTISAFYTANIQATQVNPPFPLYCPGQPLFTHMRSLSPARIIRSAIRDSLVAEGTDLHGAIISDSVIGVRSIIRPGASLKEVIMMGADYYDEENPKLINPNETSADLVPLGIGRNVTMEHCIIDKNVRIGDGVIIRRQPCDLNSDGENYYIRDGITVIPKGATLLPGTVI